ncbi:MAG: hypothetical protein AABW51_00390 [Nanoarchaeota archaeon]|mgnify:CR=1 FL=1
MEKPIVITLNDVLWYDRPPDALKNIYLLFKNKVFLQDPVQISPKNLISVEQVYGEKNSAYYWEFYRSKYYEVILEAYDNFNRFSHGASYPNLNKAQINWLRVTIHKDFEDSRIKNSIEEILSNFPKQIKS